MHSICSTASLATVDAPECDQLEAVFALIEETSAPLCGPLASAARHHLRCRGKAVRAAQALRAGAALDLPPLPILYWAAACELLHGASLVHDDMSDRDPVRRGQPAVWAAYGDDIALCLGDHLLAQSLSLAAQAEAAAGARPALLVGLMANAVSATTVGQANDLTGQPPTLALDRYLAIARAKTAPLLALSLAGPLHLAAAPATVLNALETACGELGVLYQILNDIQNLAEAVPSDLARARPNIFSSLHGAPQHPGGDAKRIKAEILAGPAPRQLARLIGDAEQGAIQASTRLPPGISALVLALIAKLHASSTERLQALNPFPHADKEPAQ